MEVEISNTDYTKSSKNLKELRDTISELDICEQTEILKILEKNQIKFTSLRFATAWLNNQTTECPVLDADTVDECRY